MRQMCLITLFFFFFFSLIMFQEGIWLGLGRMDQPIYLQLVWVFIWATGPQFLNPFHRFSIFQTSCYGLIIRNGSQGGFRTSCRQSNPTLSCLFKISRPYHHPLSIMQRKMKLLVVWWKQHEANVCRIGFLIPCT